MLSRTKRQLREVEDKIAEEANAAKAIMATANEEGRSRTDDENADIAEHHKRIGVLTENKREFEDQLEIEEQIEKPARASRSRTSPMSRSSTDRRMRSSRSATSSSSTRATRS